MNVQEFNARFLGMARIEQSISGHWPQACIMGQLEYSILRALASDECKYPVENINRSFDGIRYRDIKCYESHSSTGMVFGAVPESRPTFKMWEKLPFNTQNPS